MSNEKRFIVGMDGNRIPAMYKTICNSGNGEYIKIRGTKHSVSPYYSVNGYMYYQIISRRYQDA